MKVLNDNDSRLLLKHPNGQVVFAAPKTYTIVDKTLVSWVQGFVTPLNLKLIHDTQECDLPESHAFGEDPVEAEANKTEQAEEAAKKAKAEKAAAARKQKAEAAKLAKEKAEAEAKQKAEEERLAAEQAAKEEPEPAEEEAVYKEPDAVAEEEVQKPVTRRRRRRT